MSGMIGMIMGTSVSRAVAAPNPTAGWYTMGIYGANVQRITFATDTSAASVRGSTPVQRYDNTGVSTTENGWFCGGYVYPSPVSVVTRVTYATDTNATSNRGPLASSRSRTAAAGNTTYGYVSGGIFPAGVVGTVTTQRIDYANDTVTATYAGNANHILAKHGGVGNNNYGWFGGGYYPGSLGYYWTNIHRLDYTNDSSEMITRGPLVANKYWIANTGNQNYGWWYCGRPSGGPGTSNVQRIDYANDTATTTNRGPLAGRRNTAMGSGSNEYGYVAGGTPSAQPTATSIDRVEYANDTVTASLTGSLTLRIGQGAGVSGIQ
jgi:hypothetical protein